LESINNTESGNVRDYLIGIDDINRPKVIDMKIIESGVMNSAILLISRLILMKKGTYPDHPDMGIDIINRYRFSFDSELSMLSSEITDQVNKYLPEFMPVEVNVQYSTNLQSSDGKSKIIIQITIDKVVYELSYDSNLETIEGINRINEEQNI